MLSARRSNQGYLNYRYQALLDQAPIGILRLDAAAHILESNRAMQQLIRIPAEELADRPLDELAHPADGEELASMVRRLGKGRRERFVKECHLLRRDGQQIWTTITLAACPAEDGGVEVIGFVEDISTRKAQEAALQQRAMHDHVTQLPGRSLLYDRIGHAIRAARRQHTIFTVLVIDLDNFHNVNEVYGQHWGNIVLEQVGRRLSRRVRSSDTVARVQDDEFAVVLMGDDETGAVRSASRLHQALAKPYVARDGDRVEVGASIGMAVFPQHGEASDILLQRARHALRTARGTGLGYAIFAPLS